MSAAAQGPVPAMLISFEGRGKNRVEPGEEDMGNATVLWHCPLRRNSLPNGPVCVRVCV